MGGCTNSDTIFKRKLYCQIEMRTNQTQWKGSRSFVKQFTNTWNNEGWQNDLGCKCDIELHYSITCTHWRLWWKRLCDRNWSGEKHFKLLLRDHFWYFSADIEPRSHRRMPSTSKSWTVPAGGRTLRRWCLKTERWKPSYRLTTAKGNLRSMFHTEAWWWREETTPNTSDSNECHSRRDIREALVCPGRRKRRWEWNQGLTRLPAAIWSGIRLFLWFLASFCWLRWDGNQLDQLTIDVWRNFWEIKTCRTI